MARCQESLIICLKPVVAAAAPLSGVDPALHRHQVIDIPPIQAEVIDQVVLPIRTTPCQRGTELEAAVVPRLLGLDPAIQRCRRGPGVAPAGELLVLNEPPWWMCPGSPPFPLRRPCGSGSLLRPAKRVNRFSSPGAPGEPLMQTGDQRTLLFVRRTADYG
ncbi:MAG: hypothetical protein VKO39_12720 [Cyanobacteriota bacterium]|nr:hypothetical protein [Cyanobacteriota bacterium]